MYAKKAYHDKKYKNIKCPLCQQKAVKSLGRTFGNWGKKNFRCDNCGHQWQYGY